jgi:hypothetical protein
VCIGAAPQETSQDARHMNKGFLYRQGRYLQNKRHFLTFSTVGLGSFFALWFLFGFGEYGALGLWLFIVVISFLGAFVWGLIMWEIMGKRAMHSKEEKR